MVESPETVLHFRFSTSFVSFQDGISFNLGKNITVVTSFLNLCFLGFHGDTYPLSLDKIVDCIQQIDLATMMAFTVM